MLLPAEKRGSGPYFILMKASVTTITACIAATTLDVNSASQLYDFLNFLYKLNQQTVETADINATDKNEFENIIIYIFKRQHGDKFMSISQTQHENW